MDKDNGFIWAMVALFVCALLIGGVATKLFFPTVETKIQIERVNVPSAPIVTKEVVYVDVVKEVVKEVTVEKTVEMDLEATFLEPAIEKFLEEVEDEDEYLICGGEEYDFDSIAVKKIYDGYNVVIDDASDNEYTVNFEAKLKYLDSDVEEKCYRTMDVSVSYPKDHDSDIEVDID